jgi:hypothetical protein
MEAKIKEERQLKKEKKKAEKLLEEEAKLKEEKLLKKKKKRTNK